MSQSPSQFYNNPTANSKLYGFLWAGCIPNNGTSWTATVRAWSGANGTGSLISRTLTAYNDNYTQGTTPNSFTASGNTVSATSSNGSNGSNIMRPSAMFSGAAVGSIEIFCTYTGSAYVPTTPTFSPSAGAAGAAVTLSGTHFTDATGVWFNGTGDNTFVVNNDTTITAHVPSGATTGQVQVGNPAGNALSSTNFTVYQTPSISSFSPASGPPGTLVTINGSNFTGVTSVDFNGTGASFTFVSDTQVTATVPTGATKGRIHVVNPAGTATSVTDYQPGQIFFGSGGVVVPVAIWYSNGGAPAKIAGVWVPDGAGGVKRIW